VLQCAAVRCSALQCVAVRCSALQCVAVRRSVLQRAAVCCSVLLFVKLRVLAGSWLPLDADVETHLHLCDIGVSFLTDANFYTNSVDDLSSSATDDEVVRLRCVYEMKWTHQYSVSLYWAIMTMQTTGYGDIVPLNTWEMSFVILALFEAGMCCQSLPAREREREYVCVCVCVCVTEREREGDSEKE